MTLYFGLLGAKALYFLFAWLASGLCGSALSSRKGYGEKPGLATGLGLPFVGPLAWLFVPVRHGD